MGEGLLKLFMRASSYAINMYGPDFVMTCRLIRMPMSFQRVKKSLGLRFFVKRMLSQKKKLVLLGILEKWHV